MKSEGVLAGKRSVAAAILAGIFVLAAMLVTTAIYFYAVAAGAYIDPNSVEKGEGIHYIRYEGEGFPQTNPDNEEAHIFLVGGTDEDGYRTDAMLLVYFNPSLKANEVTLEKILFCRSPEICLWTRAMQAVKQMPFTPMERAL